MATITIITTSILAILAICAAIDIARNYIAREAAADIKFEYWEGIAQKR